MFLQIRRHLEAYFERLVPAEAKGLTAGLDQDLLSDPETALAAAPASPPDLRPLATLGWRVAPALAAPEQYVARLRLPDGRQSLHDR